MDDQKLKKNFPAPLHHPHHRHRRRRLQCRDELWSLGQRDIAIVTDHKNAGTSRNTGSDKQTYYKLTLAEESRTA